MVRAVSILAVVLCGGCSSTSNGGSNGAANGHTRSALAADAPTASLWVYSANLRSGEYPDGSGISQTLRIQCYVDAFKEHLRANNADWHLIGIQEGESVMCPKTHTTMHAADCIAAMIADGRSFRVFTNRALGVIVDTNVLDVSGDEKKAVVGYSGLLGKQRDVLAVDLTVRANGVRLLFATTHIITAGDGDANSSSSNYCFRKRQIDDLDRQLVQWGMWSGFQTILTGDFNCTNPGEHYRSCDDGLPYGGVVIMTKADSDRNLCALLKEHWLESRDFAFNVNHVSIDSHHPVGTFKTGGDIESVPANGCSNHPTAYALVETPAPTPTPACPTGQKNCATRPGQVRCCDDKRYCCNGLCCKGECVNNRCP